MAENIIQFQTGREAAIDGRKRDARRTADWLEGFDQVARGIEAFGGDAKRRKPGA